MVPECYEERVQKCGYHCCGRYYSNEYNKVWKRGPATQIGGPLSHYVHSGIRVVIILDIQGSLFTFWEMFYASTT